MMRRGETFDGGARGGTTAPPDGWRRAARGEAGVTLVEAVFAIAILTIGLLSLFALHQAAITTTQLSFRISEATFLAQDVIEQLNNEQFNRGLVNMNLNDASPDPTSAAQPLAELEHNFDGAAGTEVGGLGSGSGGGGLPIYTRSYDIEDLNADLYGNTDRILIRSRVTFEMGETTKTHGVTLIQTRSRDRYQ